MTDSGTPPLSASNTFQVAVDAFNLPPSLPFQSNQTLVGLQALTVTNTATDIDLPLNPLSYTLQAPAGAVIDTNGVIRWQPTVGQVPSTNSIVTVVTDSNPWAINSQHLSATNCFQVIVNAVHNGPLLPTQTAVRVTQYAVLTVTNTALDTDLPALGLSYSLLDAPSGADIDTNGVIRWTPGPGQGNTTNAITTLVTDSGSPALSASNTFAVAVFVKRRRLPQRYCWRSRLGFRCRSPVW